MKKKIIKGLIYFAIGFGVLFTIRIIYGYVMYPDGFAQVQQISDFRGGFSSFSKRNYASMSKSIKVKQKVYSVDQKYEKVATIKSQSENFTKDEINLRKTIKEFDALIQFEQKSGLKKQRKLKMAIGVHPDKFDEMIVKLKKLGKLLAIQIDKADKTNEYKELNAAKASLTKTRDALIALKKHGGKIAELIKLEDRILKFEQTIQKMGVQLGDFDAENEFVTIKLALFEHMLKEKQISVLKRVYTAFMWTTKYYFIMILILFFAVLSVFIILKILESLKWLPPYLEKFNDK